MYPTHKSLYSLFLTVETYRWNPCRTDNNDSVSYPHKKAIQNSIPREVSFKPTQLEIFYYHRASAKCDFVIHGKGNEQEIKTRIKNGGKHMTTRKRWKVFHRNPPFPRPHLHFPQQEAALVNVPRPCLAQTQWMPKPNCKNNGKKSIAAS